MDGLSRRIRLANVMFSSVQEFASLIGIARDSFPCMAC
jgi:hypothetical protein